MNPFLEPRLRYVPSDYTLLDWQFQYLSQDIRTLHLYGGFGAGKTEALLVAALQGCDLPDYHALIVKPTLSSIYGVGGVKERLTHMTADRGAGWSYDVLHFPEGATIRFADASDDRHAKRLQSSEYSFVGIDDAEHIPQQYIDIASSRARYSGLSSRVRTVWPKLPYSLIELTSLAPSYPNVANAVITDPVDVEPWLRVYSYVNPT